MHFLHQQLIETVTVHTTYFYDNWSEQNEISFSMYVCVGSSFDLSK